MLAASLTFAETMPACQAKIEERHSTAVIEFTEMASEDAVRVVLSQVFL